MASNTFSDLDIRHIKNGQTRFRAKVSEQGRKVIEDAIEKTGCKYPNTAFDFICTAFLRDTPTLRKLRFPAKGNNRVLVRLYPEQFELFSTALSEAQTEGHTATVALVMMCNWFVEISARAK